MSGSDAEAVSTEAHEEAAPLSDFKADWHAQAWRPAGSASLSERWLSAGTPFRSQGRAPEPRPVRPGKRRRP